MDKRKNTDGDFLISERDALTIEKIEELVERNPDYFGRFDADGGEDNLLEMAGVALGTEAVDFKDKVLTDPTLKPRTLGEVVVTMTVPGFERMEFLLAKQLTKERRKDRQVWLGLTGEEEKEQKHEVRVKTLAYLLRGEPLRVPGWKSANLNPAESPLAERFIERFSDEENETFIEQLETLYLGKLLPDEYYKPRLG